MPEDEKKKCPKCGKKMIKRDTRTIFTSYPAQYPWYWWCGCKHTEKGGVRRDLTEDELCQKEWEEANA